MLNSGTKFKHDFSNMVAKQQQNISSNDTKSKQQQQSYIKKPSNAFKLWCYSQRDKFMSEHCKMKKSQVRKMLTTEWQLLTHDEKLPFYDEAEKLKEQYYKHKYSDFVYRRKEKPVMRPTMPVTPYTPSYFQTSPEGSNLIVPPAEGSYEATNCLKVDGNTISLYGMEFSPSSPTTRASNSQCHDNKHELAKCEGAQNSTAENCVQNTFKHSNHSAFSPFPQDINNLSDCAFSNIPTVCRSSNTAYMNLIEGNNLAKSSALPPASIHNSPAHSSYKPEMSNAGMYPFDQAPRIPYRDSPYEAQNFPPPMCKYPDNDTFPF